MQIHLSLRKKLLLLVFIPFAAFVVLGTSSSLKSIQELAIIKSQNSYLDFMEKSFALIGALQVERGTSSAYVGGSTNMEKLKELRNATDGKVQVLQGSIFYSLLSEETLNQLNGINDDLKSIRVRANSRNISIAGVMEYYSEMVNTLFLANSEIASRKTTGGIGKRIVSMMILANAQEGAGRFRGYSSGVLSADEPVNQHMLFTLISDYEAVSLSLSSPGLVLSSDSTMEIRALYSSTSWIFITDTLKEILNYAGRGSYRQEYEEFWENATDVVQRINAVTLREIDETRSFNQTILDGIISSLNFTFIALAVLLVLILVLSYIFIRAITAPLNQMGMLLSRMAEGEGDLSITLPSRGRDEIARLSGNFNAFILSLNGLIGDVIKEIRNLENISTELAGSMEETAAAEAEISSILTNMEKQVDIQNDTVSKSMDVLGTFLNSLKDLHGQIEGQAAGVTQSSASIEMLLNNIRVEQTLTEQTSEQISQLVVSSKSGRENLNQVTSQIDTIARQSEQLADANTLIFSIASQTNLLAMNAAIEAAHAGEAGRGFAVVADEIRKLAENASAHSKSISQNLKSIQGHINDSVVSARSTEESFEVMNNLVETVNRLQNDVMKSVSEQVASSTEIRSALADITGITQSVMDSSNSMEERSDRILQDFQQLQQISTSVAGGMSEITTGIGEIDSAVLAVKEQSLLNQDSIRKVDDLTGRFKLADPAK